MTGNIDADDDASTINNIGSSSVETLGIDTVEELASLTADELEAELNHLTMEDATAVVKEAREAIGMNPYEPADANEDDDVDPVGGEMGVDELVDTVDETSQESRLAIDDVETVALVTGDLELPDVFDKANPDQNVASTVQRRLAEALEFNEEQIEKFVFPGELRGPSEAQEAFAHWATFTQQNVDNAAELLPEETDTMAPRPDAVDKDSFSDVEDDEWRAVYSAMKERVIDEADMVIAISNGGYVGDWVNRVTNRDESAVLIDAPPAPDDEADDSDVEDAIKESLDYTDVEG